MTNTYVSCHLSDGTLHKIAEWQSKIKNEGILEHYFAKARDLALQYDAKICDCYSKWKRMQMCGVDTTALLSNYINHPTREMHWMIATSLIETLFEERN